MQLHPLHPRYPGPWLCISVPSKAIEKRKGGQKPEFDQSGSIYRGGEQLPLCFLGPCICYTFSKGCIYELFRPSIVTIGCKVYLITMGKKGFGVIYILTETRWKLLHYKSKFSKDMINGSFASSPLHCSDFQQI